MNTATFEITKTKTLVTIVGSTSSEKIDITDTDIERDFVTLLKKISDYRIQNQILDSIDLDKWSE